MAVGAVYCETVDASLTFLSPVWQLSQRADRKQQWLRTVLNNRGMVPKTVLRGVSPQQ